MYASKQAPFLITETNAGAIGGSATNFPAFDGQWRQAAWAFVARGAEMIEYWHWHTNHFGTETYWIGILPHDQQPGRVYRELGRLGADFQRAGSRVVGLRPDAQVGLLYSARSKWGLAFQAAFPQPGTAFVASLTKTSTSGRTTASSRPSIAAPSRPACRRGCSTTSSSSAPTDDDARAPPTVADGAPGADRSGSAGRRRRDADWLREYAAAGGHLVIGPRTAYGDAKGGPGSRSSPAHLADAAGVRYQEFSNLEDLMSVMLSETDGFDARRTAAAAHRLDGRADQRGRQGDARATTTRTSGSSRPW